MPYNDEGKYFRLFGTSYDGATVFLLVWEILITITITMLWIYLTFFESKIPQKISRYLSACTFVAMMSMFALLALFIDETPAIVYWLMHFGSFLEMLIIGILSTELFKKLSVMGRYFTVGGVRNLQTFWIIWYFVCIGGQYGILFTLGRPTHPLITLWFGLGRVLYAVTGIAIDTAMNCYVIYYLIGHINQKKFLRSKAGAEVATSASERSTGTATEREKLETLNSAKYLIILALCSSFFEWLGMIIFAYVVFGKLGGAASPLYGLVNLFSLATVNIHNLWVCLQFKMLQTLAVSQNAPVAVRAPIKMLNDIVPAIASPDPMQTVATIKLNRD